MQKIQKTSSLIFLYCIFLPLNGLPWFSNPILKEASFYVSLLIIANSFKIKSKHSVFSVIGGGFLIWLAISALANYDSLMLDEKTVSMLSLFGLIIYFCALTSSVSIAAQKVYFSETIKKSSLISLYVVGALLVIEMLALEMGGVLAYIFNKVRILFTGACFSFVCDTNYARPHALSAEPSWLAMSLAIIIPFAIAESMIKKKYLSITLLLVVLLFSAIKGEARLFTVISITSILFFFAAYYIFENKKARVPLVVLVVGAVVAGLYFFFDKIFTLDIEASSSSATRLSMQLIALKAGLENPMFGIGLHQFQYEFKQYVPHYISYTNEVFDRTTGIRQAITHNLWAKLFAELGVIGVLISVLFCMRLVYVPIKNGMRLSRMGLRSEVLYQCALFSSIGCSLIASLNRELIYYPGWALIIGIAIFHNRNVGSASISLNRL